MFNVVGMERDGDVLVIAVEGTEPGESADVTRCRAAAVKAAGEHFGTPIVRRHSPRLVGAAPGPDGTLKVAAGSDVRLQQVFTIGSRL